RYIDIFSSRIGPYPHDEFHVVASPLPVGLGFPTLTYVSRQILHLPFMQERSLAHEVLHAWWGHAVAVDYGRGNWSEALTTFMADYALAEMAGDAEAREMRRGWLADFAVLPASQDRPIVSFVVRGHAASQVIGYSKGAMLFVMLRDEIGVPAFQAGLRRFWREQQFQVAAWSDLQAAFEAEAQRPLDVFFRQAQVDRILGGGGFATREDRQAAVGNFLPAGAPPVLVGKVATAPTQITDKDFRAVNDAGFTEDQIFELPVSAAIGQATRQYNSALAALDEVEG